jgi:hypothetical protein
MILGAGTFGRVAGSAATQQRSAVQALPVRSHVVQRNVTCNVATGPRPTAGGAPKPVNINLRDEGFDGMCQGPEQTRGPACGRAVATITLSPISACVMHWPGALRSMAMPVLQVESPKLLLLQHIA